MASKGPRINIELRSTGTKKNGKVTGYKKTVTTNPRNNDEKLKLEKFDPNAWNEQTGRNGKKVLFKEGKISK